MMTKSIPYLLSFAPKESISLEPRAELFPLALERQRSNGSIDRLNKGYYETARQCVNSQTMTL